jgi:EpsD family peptidyl-prolyl cis-trans isomerase
MYMTKSHASALMLVFVAVSLSACGSKEHGDKAQTQVVAKVNGDEISVHQLNSQMSRMGQLNEEQAKAVSRQLLARLVDQQLIVHQAVASKLDRDPKVLQSIENAKRDILAQAYIEQQVSSVKKPTDQEITEFYNKHPELFEKRRNYRLQELAVAAGRDRLANIENGVKSAKNLSEIANWLKEKNLQFSASSNVRAAEQLPLELLPKLNQMKDGEIVIVPAQNSINIIVLAGSQEQPLTREQSTPKIEQFLVTQRRTEFAKQQVEKLRATAKVEYLGVFADMNSTKTDKPAEAKTSDAKPADVKPDAKQGAADSAHIEKGLSGL